MIFIIRIRFFRKFYFSRWKSEYFFVVLRKQWDLFHLQDSKLSKIRPLMPGISLSHNHQVTVFQH